MMTAEHLDAIRRCSLLTYVPVALDELFHLPPVQRVILLAQTLAEMSNAHPRVGEILRESGVREALREEARERKLLTGPDEPLQATLNRETHIPVRQA